MSQLMLAPSAATSSRAYVKSFRVTLELANITNSSKVELIFTMLVGDDAESRQVNKQHTAGDIQQMSSTGLYS